eukprot:g4169.t1
MERHHVDRARRIAVHLRAEPAGATSAHITQLRSAAQAVRALVEEKQCMPIMLRLAWHDAGTYNQDAAHAGAWPSGNGAVGTIRLDKEIAAGPNAGLSKAVGYLEPIKAAHPLVSYADLIQMGGAIGVEACGGPKIDMIYGRIDAPATPPGSDEPFGLPDALPPFGGPSKSDPAVHLRYTFSKYDNMGDREIVALSGAHTIGRAFKDRSGTVENGYTSPTRHTAKGAAHAGGMQGGRSWTQRWLVFDNSYFADRVAAAAEGSELIAFPTDQVLMTDPGFAPWFQLYARDSVAFFGDYAAAHKKLSELGANFAVPGGIRL